MGSIDTWFIIAALITFSLSDHFRAINSGWSNTVVWGAAGLTALLFFASLLAHELSHSLMWRARKLPVNRITLFALGGVSVIEKEPPNALTEFLVTIVGPLTSVVLGLVLRGLAYSIRQDPEATPGLAILYWLGYINISLGIFNMLPGSPSGAADVSVRSVIYERVAPPTTWSAQPGSLPASDR